MSATRPHVVVVGAGIAGLAVAGALGPDHAVMVIDRLPAPGGVLGYEHPAVRSEVAAAKAVGATQLLGTTALRWDGKRLLVAGPRGIEWLEADELVIAAGDRPALPAEMHLLGPRVAGTFAATVAIHLAEAGVSMGRTVCLVGTGDWAARAARVLGHAGSEIVGVGPDASERPDYGEAWWLGWRPVIIEGTRRVTAMIVERGGSRQRITCDTIVLAGDTRPLRNVDGAIVPGPGIHFAQRTSDELTIDEVRADSLAVAAAIRDSRGSAAR